MHFIGVSCYFKFIERMWKKKLANFLLVWVSLASLVLGQVPGELNAIASGEIYLTSTDLATTGASKVYVVAFSKAVGTTPVGTALALAGFQTSHSQSQHNCRIESVVVANGNSGMSVTLSFTRTVAGTPTIWISLKWTYLVVSSTFDGTYTNIWASPATLDGPFPYTNVPVDPVGLAFLVQGGATGDCNIYIDPLFQADLQNCEAVPAKGENQGGKIILHSYISGFRSDFSTGTSQVEVSKADIGVGTNPKSDSEGWEVVFGDPAVPTSPPYGPKVKVPGGNLVQLQISFVYTRMDFYAPHYPLNSELQYSSSHIFESVGANINLKTKLERGGVNDFNQNYFLLPEATYLIYGLSSFTTDAGASPIDPLSITLNLDKEHYWCNIPYSNVQGVIISADLFVQNVMQLCQYQAKSKALKGRSKLTKILPLNSLYSAVDVTQFVPLQKLSPSHNPVVFRYGIPSTTSTDRATFVNVLIFRPPDVPSSTLRLELRFFESLSVKSLIAGQVYQIEVKVNGEVVFREEYTHTVSVVNPENFMSDIIYRALPSQPSKRVRVVTKVSFLGNPSSQEFYLLAAVYQENTVYDPSTQSCLPSCPINSGYDARVYPMTCFSCNAAIGMVFSVREAACRCKEGTYFDAALLVCKSCGPNCASCDPASPTTCFSCLGLTKLMGTECGCRDGTYLANSSCLSCPHQCLTCIGPGGLCLTCNKNVQWYSRSCPCASGYFDYSLDDCGVCNINCLTCSQSDPCLSCQPGLNRLLLNGQCKCAPGFFQNSMGFCEECDPSCQECQGTMDNCISCNPAYNRVLSGSDCNCQPGHIEAGAICVISNCPTNPLCLDCQLTTGGMTICTKCVQNLNRVLNSTLNQCVCQKSFFDWNGVCKKCSPGCQTCQSQALCSACATLASPNPDGSCSCPPKTYLSASPDHLLFCQGCPPLCLQCANNSFCSTCECNAIQNKGICTCQPGYFHEKGCGKCEICKEGCKECDEEGCLSCVSPLVLSGRQCLRECCYGFHEYNGICQPCVQFCSECLSWSACSRCQEGYFLEGGQCLQRCGYGMVGYQNCYGVAVCAPCEPPCSLCSVSPTNCTECLPHYHLYSHSTALKTCERVCPRGTIQQGRICQPCSNGCLSCVRTPDNCNSCAQPLIHYKGRCVEVCNGVITTTSLGKYCHDTCPPGSFEGPQKICKPCSPPCETCNMMETNCTSCKQGILADYGICTEKCQSGQYILGGKCFNCSYPCLNCFRAPDYCVSCAKGMVVSAGKCIINCPDLQYYHPTLMACQPCDPACLTCLDSKTCLTCLDPTHVPKQGLCPFCEAKCQECGHDNRCRVCKLGFFAFNGACLQDCPGNTVKQGRRCACPQGILMHDRCQSSCEDGFYPSGGICLLCDSNCRYCSQSFNNCTRCFDRHTLSNGQCLPQDDCPYGQALTNGVCSRLCLSGTYYFQGYCVFRCRKGFEPNPSGGCIRKWQYQCPERKFYLEGSCEEECPEQYYPNHHSQKCQQCPQNCQKCINRQECYECSEDYVNIKGRCYFNDCEEGKVSVGEECTEECPEGTRKKRDVCVPRCPQGQFLLDDLCYSTCPSNENTPFACLPSLPCRNSTS